jgi:hypothetical protein
VVAAAVLTMPIKVLASLAAVTEKALAIWFKTVLLTGVEAEEGPQLIILVEMAVLVFFT